MASLLQTLENNIQDLKAQQAHKENTLTIIAPEEQERIRQQIRALKENIARKREEFFEELADMSDEWAAEEQEAAVITAEIVEAVSKIEQRPDASEEMLVILRDIHGKLNEPELTAAAKLKGIISSFPPFIGVTYEAELDTEQFLRQYFPTFRKWYLAAAKKP